MAEERLAEPDWQKMGHVLAGTLGMLDRVRDTLSELLEAVDKRAEEQDDACGTGE